jgi:uncharacterized protein (DUF2344 family)
MHITEQAVSHIFFHGNAQDRSIDSPKKIHIIEKKAYRISICYESIVQLLEVQKNKKESQLDSYYFLSAGQKRKKRRQRMVVI